MMIKFRINGEDRQADVKDNEKLIDFIREDLGLTGTKEGCREGECGACTVIMNGKIIASCLTYAYAADGAEIFTIEGKNSMKELEIIQKSFVDAGAIQCGYCTPGMILASKVLLDSNPDPTREEIREGLEGNFCRCTGYTKIVDAVMLSAKRLQKERCM